MEVIEDKTRKNPIKWKEWTLEDFKQRMRVPVGALGLCILSWFDDFMKSDVYEKMCDATKEQVESFKGMLNLYMDVRAKMHYRGDDHNETIEAIKHFNTFMKSNIWFRDTMIDLGSK